MAKKTKFFRVAVEGPTADGREIERDLLVQMAQSYSPDLYGARINIEHVQGFAPMSAGSPFGAYGDVVALKAEVITDGPDALKGKMALYAQIDPTNELVALSKARQKIYTSVEIGRDFARTGKAYLLGIAATDSPASLGTNRLEFTKHTTRSEFSDACETAIEIDGADTPNLLQVVRNLFGRHREAEAARDGDTRQAIQEVATFAAGQAAEISTLRTQVAEAQATADNAIEKLAKLTEELSLADDDTPSRPRSTGTSDASGEFITDF